MSGHFDILEAVDFKKLHQLYNETAHHLELLNLKESVEHSVDNTNLLNVALENVLFLFRKVSEAEMVIADQLKDTLRKTREALNSNFDQQDPEFITLYEELKRLFAKKNLDEITQEEMKQNMTALQKLQVAGAELNRKNNLLKAKYNHDAKYARIHKRLLERGNLGHKESEIGATLMTIKQKADNKILMNSKLLNNENYFQGLMMNVVFDGFEQSQLDLAPETALYINDCLVKEYLNEYQGNPQW